MQRLSQDFGTHAVIRALRFLELRLLPFPEAAAVTQQIGANRAELVEAQEEYEAAYTERLAATAEVSYRDDVVDDAVMNLAKEALRLVNDRRDDPRYLALFPITPSDAVASTASHRQHRFVHDLLMTLQNDARLAPLRAHAATLGAKQAALQAALEERERCFVAETQATRRRTEALDEACRAYNRSHSRLQLVFRDGARIESCYPILSAPRGPDSE